MSGSGSGIGRRPGQRTRPADLIRTDRLPVVGIPAPRPASPAGCVTSRTPAPAARTGDTARLPVITPRQRRRAGVLPLTPAEDRLAELIDTHLRRQHPDAELARALGVPTSALAPLLTRLRTVARAYARRAEHDPRACPACTDLELCDDGLAPLQQWFDALHAVARAAALLANTPREPSRRRTMRP